jgi:hypothetical protein
MDLDLCQRMRFAVHFLISRTYPFIDSQSLGEHQARDTLFRIPDGTFLLHLSSSDRPVEDDRLVWIDCRTALIWINAAPEDFGTEWE